jgi:hypothetical protein
MFPVARRDRGTSERNTMLKTLKRTAQAMRRRVGPVGLSLVAAALTATAFAAVSTAAKDDGGGDTKADRSGAEHGFEMRVGPPPELSEEDEAKLEEFRQCMEDNGAPAPPEPGEMRKRLEDGEMPEPPTDAEIEKIRKAHEACEDKLPEGAELGLHGCGGPGGPPPPGAREGTAIPAPPSGGSQGDVEAAPQGSTS